MTKIFIKLSAMPIARRQSDENLIKAVAEGDSGAMQILYQRHCARVKRFVLRLTDNVSIVDDIVSEAFLDVWRQADTFQNRSQVTTWLLAIARNKALSMLKRACSEQLDEKATRKIEDPSDDPEIIVSKLRRDALVHKCLKQLRPAHRQIVDLIYYQEKSVGEVAHLIGIPPSTVKTRMFYARNRLANQLRKEGVDRASL
jgi:RNA polymerase sigma-70 factor, ECF subfamily